MPQLIGYARVSTADQNPRLQTDALEKAGCARVFSDKASGTLDERPELNRLMDFIRDGDTLVVWRLDRLGRSLRHLVGTVTNLSERSIGFVSLHENIDTTTPGGRLVFHVFAALAEFERDLISERTVAGLAAARARGRNGGRPSVMTDAKLRMAREMYGSGEHTVSQIADATGVSRATIYRHLDPTEKSMETGAEKEREDLPSGQSDEEPLTGIERILAMPGVRPAKGSTQEYLETRKPLPPMDPDDPNPGTRAIQEQREERL